SSAFYTRLPARKAFETVADPSAYAPLPADWWIVITDVEGSTAAVAAGRYRDVNFVGAACIAAVLNTSGETEVPFIFGGDGATMLVPPALARGLRPVLRTVRRIAADDFGLALRVGLVPVADVYARGARVDVLRLEVSEGYAQAMVSGGGLALAEALVKGAETGPGYALGPGPAADDPTRALFEGLECRWQEVESPDGEIVALLVTATAPDEAARAAAYRDALAAIEGAYGPAARAHPLARARLRLMRRPSDFAREAMIRAATPAERRAYRRREFWLTQLGRVLMALRLRTERTDWGRYPALLRASTDVRKFDDTLRMILSGTPAQRAALEAELEHLRAAGALVYGVHVSPRATLTCLVFDRMGRQVHFVDGSGGGYTAAARQLKAQLKQLEAGHRPARP
ncbi:MAG: DUF3095 domain-containing protein, partial [Rubricoccaceae bacterium]